MSAASVAFGSRSGLSLDQTPAATPPDQQGRRRLPNSYLIRREQLAPDPTQPRKLFDEQELAELAASIQSRGIKQPLTVRWDTASSKYMLIDGGRRFLAAERLGLDELPCWIQDGDTKDVLVDQIVHNWQRADLRPEETADALARLRDDFDLSQKQISDMTGKPQAEISKFLAVHDKVILEVQQMAREQSGTAPTLTMRHLYNISKLPQTEQKSVADQIHQSQLTATETEELVARTRGRSHRGSAGLQARQRRFHTDSGDMLITFNKPGATNADVERLLNAVRDQLSATA